MPSHLSTIGIPVETEQQFWELAQQVGPLATGLPVIGGTYFQWTDSSGAELWLQVTNDEEFIGMNPHFVGQSSMTVRLTSRVRSEEGSPFDGGFYGWADPVSQSDDAQEGLYPFVFDAPDFTCVADLELPATVTVQMAAFAHEVEAYDSEEAYAASQTGAVKYASRSFIPSGLFRPDGVEEPLPEARAMMTGHVLAADRFLNTLTNQPFYWALIETYGGTYDAVIDISLLSGAPIVGGILSGSFWLSGRVVSSA